MNSSERSGSSQKLKIAVPMAGREFEFELWHRVLTLGEAGNVTYYWMDSSQFRGGLDQPEEALRNLQNCLGIWWRAAKAAKVSKESGQICQFLLASCYPMFARNKSLQQIFHDAFLRREREEADPDDEQQSREALKNTLSDLQLEVTLKALLGGSALTPDEIAVCSVAIQFILDDGVSSFRADQQRGTIDFLAKVNSWSKNVRQRGRHAMRRLCLNQLAYSAKVSFYGCYAQAWIHIVQELERRGLDEISSRFLRFWHWQNPSTEYPDGSRKPHAFGGQVLALHPLSGFFMHSPALLEVAGEFFGGISNKEFDLEGYGTRPEYRSLLNAILIAANRYDSARQTQTDRLPQRSKISLAQSGLEPIAVADPETPSLLDALKECLEAQGERCWKCDGALSCVSYDVSTNTAVVQARCLQCGTDCSVGISVESFRRTFFN